MSRTFTPRELELMVKHELAKEREIPDALMVQIVRVGDSWRATSRFKSHNHSADVEQEIATRVGEIGYRFAKQHRLIG